MLNGLRGLLISDGVGVGKTISAGFIFSHYLARLKGPHLVICSPIMVYKWKAELQQKFSISANLVRNEAELRTMNSEVRFGKGSNAVYVLASSLLSQKYEFGLAHIGLIVMDEIHTWRNRDTRSHKAILDLSRRASIRVGLTATPINNSLDDLLTEFSLVLAQYDPLVIRQAVQEIWESRTHSLAAPIMTRFLKERLGFHFAKRRIEWAEVDYGKDYARWAHSLIERRRGRPTKKGSFPFDTVTFYRLASSSPVAFATSMEAVPPDWPDPKGARLEEIVRANPDRYVVFVEFQETVEYLSKRLPQPVFKITGETPQFSRQAILEAFRATPFSVLLMTPVGGEGIDLQFCNRLINYDLNWNPMVLEQRIGRVDRRGQRKEEIYVHNFLVKNSIDDRILHIISEKIKIVEGSPLANLPLIAEQPKTNAVLYDSESIRAESKRSEETLDILAQNANLIEEDYAVAESVDSSYCSPERVAATEGHPWLMTSDSRQWVSSIRAAAEAFKKRLDELQAVL